MLPSTSTESMEEIEEKLNSSGSNQLWNHSSFPNLKGKFRKAHIRVSDPPSFFAANLGPIMDQIIAIAESWDQLPDDLGLILTNAGVAAYTKIQNQPGYPDAATFETVLGVVVPPAIAPPYAQCCNGGLFACNGFLYNFFVQYWDAATVPVPLETVVLATIYTLLNYTPPTTSKVPKAVPHA